MIAKGIIKSVLGKGGALNQVTDIVKSAVTDKDKQNEIINGIALVMLNSKIAPYIRGVLGIMATVSIFFFGDKLTISPESQDKVLWLVFGFYFLDFLTGKLGKSK